MFNISCTSYFLLLFFYIISIWHDIIFYISYVCHLTNLCIFTYYILHITCNCFLKEINFSINFYCNWWQRWEKLWNIFRYVSCYALMFLFLLPKLWLAIQRKLLFKTLLSCTKYCRWNPGWFLKIDFSSPKNLFTMEYYGYPS